LGAEEGKGGGGADGSAGGEGEQKLGN